jgi:hypothetical protein
MPVRFWSKLKWWQRRFLAERDGDKCAICGVEGREKLLVVHHVDSNPENNDPANLKLLCQSCNVKEGMKAKPVVEEGVNKEEKITGYPLKSVVDYSQGSTEMQANDIAEGLYLEWLSAKIRANGEVQKSEAINGGAQIAGVSPSTTRKYLDKLISDEGPMQDFKHPKWKKRYIRFKSDQPKEEEAA